MALTMCESVWVNVLLVLIDQMIRGAKLAHVYFFKGPSLTHAFIVIQSLDNYLNS